MNIGQKGLAEVDLTIPQATTLSFTVVHRDSEGNVVDHSASELHMAMRRKSTTDLSSCCHATAEAVSVSIPKSVTETLALGTYKWDLMAVTQSGESFRLCYGTASVVDTYALDGEDG